MAHQQACHLEYAAYVVVRQLPQLGSIPRFGPELAQAGGADGTERVAAIVV